MHILMLLAQKCLAGIEFRVQDYRSFSPSLVVWLTFVVLQVASHLAYNFTILFLPEWPGLC